MMPRIPEPPKDLIHLDLMKRLKAYADGAATWNSGDQILGPRERKACELLHANLTDLIEKCLHPLMDRISAREMQTFTMHDRNHGIKVAHLMWHIINPDRQQFLTPGEIALLVTSAHVHDLGMGLSDEERKARLQPQSDLWDSLDPDSKYSKIIEKLFDTANENSSDAVKNEALFQIQQAQEALLCADTRERHATRERYQAIITSLKELHALDPNKIPNIRSALVFDGDSFEEKLIEICISHNEDAHTLLDRDPSNIDQWRFPVDYPIGCCIANIRLVAAALRLADVLDFDRERTPPILFHYLLPRSAKVSDNVSLREWSKHLAISNWEIDSRKIIFRGRSPSAVIHHAIVQFCKSIEDEISRTLSIFGDAEWPFILQPNVEPAIEASGYRYVPYSFSLDEERIYQLLMGRSIYSNSLDALRELIQNSLDACKLRDALMRAHDGSIIPTKVARIIVQYEEAEHDTDTPIIRVVDSGIGMDRYVIENYFLKVGRSYYRSSDFLKIRSSLRRCNLDFSPVSEFGIGFMSAFMLGDRINVDTARTYPPGLDNQRRMLRIDGLGRLIEVVEEPNIKLPRFQGTRVSIQLNSETLGSRVVAFAEVESYLRKTCINLAYPIHLRHITSSGEMETIIAPQGLTVPIPEHLRATAITLDVDDKAANIVGQIVLFRESKAKIAQAAFAKENPVVDRDSQPSTNLLIRGGFAVGKVRGLPNFIFTPAADARIEVTWQDSVSQRLPATDIGRTRLTDHVNIDQAVLKAWMTHLLRNISSIERSPIGAPNLKQNEFNGAKWLEDFSAYRVYRLARTSWISQQSGRNANFLDMVVEWESSRGKPLILGWPNDSLHRELLDLILPHVTDFVVGEQGRFHVAPPKRGWKTKLRNLNNFISNRKEWGLFAQYAGRISNSAYDKYPGNSWFNKKYAKNFSSFTHDEIIVLQGILDSCISARKFEQAAKLTKSESILLQRATRVAGDLYVSDLDAIFHIKDFSR